MSFLDVEREFYELWGNVELCGIETDAAVVLKAYDPDAYEAAVDNYAAGRGYYKCPDRGEWFESYEAMKDHDSSLGEEWANVRE